jgi:hypothetical protein
MLGEEGAVMTTLDGVTKKKPAEQSAEAQAAAELLRLAQEQRLSLTVPQCASMPPSASSNSPASEP